MATNRRIVCLFCCCMLAWSLQASAATSNRVSVAIECESISKLLADMESISKALNLRSSDSKLANQVGEMIMSPDLTGICSNKPISAFLVLPGNDSSSQDNSVRGPNPIVLVLPLADNGDSYLKAVGNSFRKSEKNGNITHFTEPADDSSAEEPDMFVAVAGDKAVIGPDRDNICLILSQLSRQESMVQSIRNIQGTMKIRVDICAIIDPIEKALKKTEETIRQAATPTPPAMPTVNPSQIIAAESDLILTFMRQLDTFSAGIRVNGNTIEINSRITPANGSALAATFKNLTPPSGKYIASMPSDSCMASAGSGMNIIDIFAESYADAIQKMFAAMDPEWATIGAQMRKTILSVKGSFSGNYAFGVVPDGTGKGLSLVEVFAVKNPAMMRGIIMDSITNNSAMCEKMIPGLSMTLAPSRTNAGVEIIKFSSSLKAQAPTPAQMPIMPPASIFSNYKAEIAFAGNDMIIVIGGTPAVMDTAIERTRNGSNRIDKTSAFVNLFPNPPSAMVSVYSFEPLKLIKSLVSSSPGADQLQGVLPASTSGIAGYTTLNGSDLVGITRIGLDEVSAIQTSLPAIGILLLPMLMNNANMPSPDGTVPRAAQGGKCLTNLRMLEAAKDQCALEKGLKDGDAVKSEWIQKYLLQGRMPICPKGGKYKLNPIGAGPTCTIPGHTL